MNNKAKNLGMNNTYFSNPIGMDNTNNKATLEDVLILLKYWFYFPTMAGHSAPPPVNPLSWFISSPNLAQGLFESVNAVKLPKVPLSKQS